MHFPSHDVRARIRHVIGAAIVALGLASPFDAAAAPGDGAPLVVARAAKKKKKKHSAAPKRKKGGKKATKRKGRADAAPVKSTRIPFDLPVERLSLANGLRVVLSVDHGSPTIAVAVSYDVGAHNEPPLFRGASLLLGELFFQGSKNLDKGEHARLVGQRGGRVFSDVGVDRCDFGEALPSSELALALFLEADRMKSLALDLDEAGFASMRARVKDKLAAKSSAIFGTSRGRLRELVYQGYSPYTQDIASLEEKLSAIGLEDLRAFQAHNIGPNNAVLTIAGDFDPEEAKRLVHRFFDDAPRIKIVPQPESRFPEQTSQRTAVVRDDLARAPQVLYGWAIPPSRGKDHEALELAAQILGEGQSSRLYHRLVRDKAMARAVSARTGDRRGPDIFAIEVELLEGVKVGHVEKIIEGELKSLMRAGPSDAELERAKMRAQARALAEMQSNISRARRLGEYELFYNDAGLLNGKVKRYFELTKNDIKRAVAKHLGPTRRTIVETYPTAALSKAKK